MQTLAQLGERFGFSSETDGQFSISLLLPGTTGQQKLGILGHLDVVPEGSGWKYPPFAATEKDGYLIGRGSRDNKGPVIMSLYVMRCLKELGIPLKSTVRLIAGCREETDMLDVQHYLQTHEPPAFTLNCDGAWAGCIGEKGILEADLAIPVGTGNLLELQGGTVSNMTPDHAYAIFSLPDGTLQRIDAAGKSAHCCMPHQGENAIIHLLKQLVEEKVLTGEAASGIKCLYECFPDDYGHGLRLHHEDALSGKTTCVPSLLRLEEDHIRLHFNARTALSQRKEWMLNTLEKRLTKANVRLENVRWTPPRYTDPKEPPIQLLLDTCKTFLAPKAKPYVMGGATHSRFFPHSLPFGPENMDPRIKRSFGKAHEPNEAVYIDDLLQAIKIYIIALKRLDDYFSKPTA